MVMMSIATTVVQILVVIAVAVVVVVEVARQISQFGAVLQTFSRNRVVCKLFPRGCCFCTYPTCKSQLGVATSCMVDTWRALEGRANLVGNFSLEAPVLLAPQWKRQYCWRFQPRAGSFSAARASFQQLCRWGSATPFGDLGEVRKRHSLWRFRLFKTPLPLVF